MDVTTPGIHHVTAISGDPQTNIDFYTGVLGLRLVKLTVNFDDPSTYHLYYADYAARPGTVLTFFPWSGAPHGRAGTGQVSTIGFLISEASVDYWVERLNEHNIGFLGPGERFDEQVLTFLDPDGIELELVARKDVPANDEPQFGPVPPQFAIRGFHGVTLTLAAYERTAGLLTQTLGFTAVTEEGSRFRYDTGSGALGSVVDIVLEPSATARRTQTAVGSVHHVAFRTPDDDHQLALRERLVELGFGATPVCDRQYFHSIYFREPGGVLFEIATDGPGFELDESLERLGTELKLPPWYERDRASIESLLAPIRLPEVRVMG